MNMQLSMGSKELTRYTISQIENLFPDGTIDPKILYDPVQRALARAAFCFSRINNKYFFDGSKVFFNHLHSDQYAMFLYFLSNTIWQEMKDGGLAGKVYYLNKVLHSIDVYYEVDLPKIFLFVHCVGTVLGRATYRDYLVIYQRVTVGGNSRLQYPKLGEGVVLYGDSALIGNCRVGDNCLFSYGTTIMDRDIPRDTIISGKYPIISQKKSQRSVIERFFFYKS